MYAHPLKCVLCNQNTNTNVFPQINISSKMCALQPKYKYKYDPQMCIPKCISQPKFTCISTNMQMQKNSPNARFKYNLSGTRRRCLVVPIPIPIRKGNFTKYAPKYP